MTARERKHHIIDAVDTIGHILFTYYFSWFPSKTNTYKSLMSNIVLIIP
jgi:uncharacterized BrkB/YihY/UPF0761 family membrane protein